ncbi:helix-turn-helix domain-containing protein [Streptomyces exfoliatus]|uniref:helix-turn-helix domain-containing protein n=1 Tax=Streptomyces exfoliatus TaxID=1905 RepID=UPI000464B5BE|nr:MULTISPECIES: helix-turn-helix domain-containing protein [Streptomyces]MDV5145452.1 helix-turn-helix domain-containing protein [Streptomyces sp. SBC-4]
MIASAPVEVASAPELADLQSLAAAARLLARLGDVESLLTSGPKNRDDRLHFDYPEAARRLNVTEKWLRERISRLPHRKLGKFVQFTEDDLLAISDMHFVRPDNAEKELQGSATPALIPSGRSRRRA